jgi:hypothetical protein
MLSAHWQLISVGGYTLAVAALVLGVAVYRRPGWRLVSRVAYGFAGSVAAFATACTLSRGTFDGRLLSFWELIPVAFTALVWWRGYRQATWMRRLGVPYRDSGVEFEVQGHRVQATQFTAHAPDRPGLRRGGKLDQALTMADSTYNLVQLRTPVVPAMVISPLVGENPFEEARITRNRFADVLPDGPLRTVDGPAGFAVRSTDPEVARGLLTPEVQRLIADDPWCRVRTIVFDGGALLTAESGQLTESVALGNSRHLAMIAAGVAWDGPFAEIARAADTSSARWFGGRQRLMTAINDRRLAANRPPLSPGSIIARLVTVLGLGVLFGIVAVTSLRASKPDQAVSAFVILALVGFGFVRWTFFPKRRQTRN